MKILRGANILHAIIMLAMSMLQLHAASQSNGNYTVNISGNETGDLTVQGAAHFHQDLDFGTTSTNLSAGLLHYSENGAIYTVGIAATRPATSFLWQDNDAIASKNKMLLGADNSLSLFDAAGASGIVLNPNTGLITLSGSGSGIRLSDGTMLTNAASLRSAGLYNATGTLAATATTDGKVNFPNGILLGNNNVASGANAFASGSNATASGVAATAHGTLTTASGNSSTALGTSTVASGVNSIAGGNSSTANGTTAIAFGEGTIAQAYDSLVLGRFNVAQGNSTAWVTTDDLFTIGIGANAATRANAFVVRKSGDVAASKNFAVSGTTTLGTTTHSGTTTFNNTATFTKNVTFSGNATNSSIIGNVTFTGNVILGGNAVISGNGSGLTSLSKTQVGLGNVENTAISTWPGSANITTLGTISAGTVPVARVSGLAAVATSGSYSDLSNKPTIPAAQVNSDWSASSGLAQILNKPTLAAVATSGSYNDLSGKPTLGTAAATDTTAYATAAQGAKANSALQSVDLFPHPGTFVAPGYASQEYVLPGSFERFGDDATCNLIGYIPTGGTFAIKDGTGPNGSIMEMTGSTHPTSRVIYFGGIIGAGTATWASTPALDTNARQLISADGLALNWANRQLVGAWQVNGTLTLADGTVLANASSLRSTALYTASGNVALSVATNGQLQAPKGIAIPTGGSLTLSDGTALTNAASLHSSSLFTTNGTAAATATTDGKVNFANGITLGSNNGATGSNSFASGNTATANGTTATAFGEGTIAQAYDSIALGRFNVAQGNATAWVATDDLFTIGIGGNATTRANAFVVKKSGDVTASKNLAVSGTTTLSGTTTHTGTTTFNGLATFTKNITFSGNATNSVISGNLTLAGNTTTLSANTTTVTGNATFAKNVAIAGNTTLNGNTTINGALVLSDGTILANAASLRSSALYTASGNVAVSVGADGKVQFANGITLPGGALGSAAYADSAAYATSGQGTLAASALQPTGNGGALTGLTATQVGLGNVENTPLSTWVGSTNITTLGTISAGTVPVARVSGLAPVATSGSFSDLINKPTIPAGQVNSDWNAASGLSQILNKPTFAAVAISGSYNDLSGKPAIPAAQVQSDWSASSGMGQILNKPTLASVALSGSYPDLSGKPTLGTAAATAVTDYATAAQGAKADSALQPNGNATLILLW